MISNSNRPDVVTFVRVAARIEPKIGSSAWEGVLQNREQIIDICRMIFNEIKSILVSLTRVQVENELSKRGARTSAREGSTWDCPPRRMNLTDFLWRNQQMTRYYRNIFRERILLLPQHCGQHVDIYIDIYVYVCNREGWDRINNNGFSWRQHRNTFPVALLHSIEVHDYYIVYSRLFRFARLDVVAEPDESYGFVRLGKKKQIFSTPKE